jgi:hypothetical protein
VTKADAIDDWDARLDVVGRLLERVEHEIQIVFPILGPVSQ